MTNTTLLRVSAVGLVAGALSFTFADLIRRLVVPSGSPGDVAITHAVDQHGAAWLTAGLLSLLGSFGLVAGAAGLLATARGRGAGTTTVGASLLAIGALASVGHAVAFYSPYALYVDAGTPDAAVKALGSANYPMLVVLIVVFIVGMMLGSIVLLAGLRRARRVPIWSVVAAVVFVVCGSSSGVATGVLGIVAAVVCFVPAGRSLLASEPERAHSQALQDRAEELAHP